MPVKERPSNLSKLGVHSEVGHLRTALVCRPGLAHLRLTPDNCRALLFDDMLWVERAQHDFAQFVRCMQDRGVEVLELHDLLAQTLARADAKRWLLAQKIAAKPVGLDLLDDLRSALAELPHARLAELLIGGLTKADLPFKPQGLLGAYLDLDDFVLPPLPNTVFTRDTTCWVGPGVCLNHLFWPARRGETLLMAAIYQYHPRFENAGFNTWFGDGVSDLGLSTLEGGDVMNMGEGVVLVGMGGRSSPQAAMQLAQVLLTGGAATTVIAAKMPRSSAAVHLDTVFTPCDANAVTYFPEVVDKIVCHELRLSARSKTEQAQIHLRSHPGRHVLDVLAECLQVPTLRAIATGGNHFEAEREQWDDGNNVLALSPGVVVAYDRNVTTNKRLRQAGIEVIEIPGGELSRSRAGPHGMVCPVARDAVSYH
jgi:arginine deiminase